MKCAGCMGCLCLKLHVDMLNFQYASIGRSPPKFYGRRAAVPGVLQSQSTVFVSNNDRFNNGLSIALPRAQIFSRYLSSRRVTEKFRCSTCLPRTPHCVTVNSSRLYEHPRHNRVAQHTNRWTLAHSRVYLIQGAPTKIGLRLEREIEKKRRKESKETRIARKSHADSLFCFGS